MFKDRSTYIHMQPNPWDLFENCTKVQKNNALGLFGGCAGFIYRHDGAK